MKGGHKMREDVFTNGNGINHGISRATNGMLKELKIITVGDGMVGKTCMLSRYTSQEFPKEFVPTVFENHPMQIKVDDIIHHVTLWVTAGQEDYEILRPLSYPNTNCFLLCYSVNNRSSYDNILLRWYPELNHHCPNVPIILICTKSDLRDTPEAVVTPSEGKRMKREIRAYRYMECSALNNEGLDEIFIEAIRCVHQKKPLRKRNCILL